MSNYDIGSTANMANYSPLLTGTIEPKWANTTSFGYYFQSSLQKYNDLVELYGPPDLFKDGYGGIAIWLKKDIYCRIELRDVVQINNFPFPHNNIMNVVYGIKIKFDEWRVISQLCGNIYYDDVAKELHISCPTVSYGNALCAVVAKMLLGTLTWRKVNNFPILTNALSIKRLQDINHQESDINTIKNLIEDQKPRIMAKKK